MNIGVPKEIKNHEYRVGLSPASVYELVYNGHTIYIETLEYCLCSFLHLENPKVS